MAVATVAQRAARPQFICQECFSGFSTAPSAARRGNPRFCSKGCGYSYRKRTGDHAASKPKISVTCEVCSVSSYVHPSKSAQRFCSQKCMIVWRSGILSARRYRPETHIDCTCQWCGAVFETAKSRLDGSRGKFCSRQCLGSASVRKQGRISVREQQFGCALESAGAQIVRQHRIGRWTVDFYSPSFGVAVEFDGEYWHGTESGIARDIRKDIDLRSKGIRIVRVPERLWLQNPSKAVRLALDGINGAAT